MRIKLIFLSAILSFIDFGAVIKKKTISWFPLGSVWKEIVFLGWQKGYVTSLTCILNHPIESLLVLKVALLLSYFFLDLGYMMSGLIKYSILVQFM